jgi:hypothetical protein
VSVPPLHPGNPASPTPGLDSQALPDAPPASLPSSAQASFPPAPVPTRGVQPVSGAATSPQGPSADSLARPSAPYPSSGAPSSVQQPRTQAPMTVGPADPLMSAHPTRIAVAPSQPDRSHTGSSRPLPILIAAGLGLVISLSAGVAALRHPQLCNLIGICESSKRSSPASSSSERALRAGEAAVRELQKAVDFTSYRRALEDLDNQLFRLSGDLLDAGQQQRRDRLQEQSGRVQARLKQESSDAALVGQAKERIDALPSLPAASAETSRTEIRRSLSAISSSSFSHSEAQSQLKRLDATTAPSEPAPAELPAAAPSPSAEPPTPEPLPAPAPRPRSADRWQDGGGGWSAPRRPAPVPAPAPAPPQDDGESNAPYRSEPLF